MNIKRGIAFAAAACSIAGLGMATAPSASASTSPNAGLAVAKHVFAAGNPQAAYKALSAADKAAFNSVEQPATASHTQTATPLTAAQARALRPASGMRPMAYSGCWALSDTWGEKAAAGNTLFTYWQATEVCVSNGRVTGVSVYNYGGETSTPGWYKSGDATSATFNAGWEGRGYVQVNYALGVNGWNIQHLTPCGQLRLNGNGYNYAVSSSCNLN
ncbi:hypothetical protein [Streptacidiphilus sp. EB129]|uniref:hypothetical protein n=1 Tax=Streptacidiphilus sp. EB129 TaxID=3156262 RepID=UPI00351579BF